MHAPSSFLKSLALMLAFSFFMYPFVPFFANTVFAQVDEASPRVSEMNTVRTVVDSQTEVTVGVPIVSNERIEKSGEQSLSDPVPVLAKEVKNKEQASDTDKDLPQVESVVTPQQTTSNQSQAIIKPEINNSTGALTYVYPILLPKGRLNMTPEIGLNYNSQNSESSNIFGHGWQLSVPFIQRRGLHGADQLYTGVYNDFTSSVHGDLVQIPSTTNYRPESMTEEYPLYSFANNSFVFTDKNGTTYRYGLTANSRQDDVTDPAKVYTWMLEKVSDSNGNFISYTYFKDQGQIYPDSITYTNTNAITGIYVVQFVRQVRSDSIESYKSAFLVKTDYRIAEIQIKTQGVLSKSYTLNYGTGNNGMRSMLVGVTETAYANGVEQTMPETEFGYTTSTGDIFGLGNPQNAFVFQTSTSINDGIVMGDMNGDAYPDLLKAYEFSCYNYSQDKQALIYNPQTNTYVNNQNYDPPAVAYAQITKGCWTDFNGDIQLVDLNGDMKNDLVNVSRTSPFASVTNFADARLNTGASWSQTNSSFIPAYIANPGYVTFSQDLNGDGLVDYFQDSNLSAGGLNYDTKASVNNGSGFTVTTINTSAAVQPTVVSTPVYTGTGQQHFVFDINGDGLPDIIESYANSCGYTGPVQNIITNNIYIHTGKNWTLDNSYVLPQGFAYLWNNCGGVGNTRIALNDFNGDGLNDIWQIGGNLYLNQGKSFMTTTFSNGFYNIINISSNYASQNKQLIGDFNADGLTDIILPGFNGSPGNNFFVKNTISTPVDLLSSVTTATGALYEVSYKSSAQYKDAAGTLLNPALPFIVQTVESITANDNNGNVETTNYTYADGSYYYAGPFDRKFSGFGIITETTPSKTTKIYYHQGNTTNSALGEYLDTKAKIGREYRQEVYSPLGVLEQLTTTKWQQTQIGVSNAYFVYPINRLVRTANLPGSFIDRGELYTWNTGNGTLATKIEQGLVSGNNNGTFSNIGTDTYTTTYAYISNGSTKVVVPNKVTLKNNANTIEQEIKYYYDNSLTGVNKGNLTKTDTWISGVAYASNQTTYNSMGLPLSQIDPNGNTTTYTYDIHNLYPITITRPLGIVTSFVYDYTLGKPLTFVDPNNKSYAFTYDAFGRTLTESVPDPTTGASVVKRSFVYTDIPGALAVKENVHLSLSNIVETQTYFDGFRRPIQATKDSFVDFATVDTIYNPNGTVQKVSLPYANSTAAKVAPTTDQSLYTTFAYDSLSRPVTETNALGVTTHSYAGYAETVTDANGRQKTYTRDVYGNLASVTEYLNSIPYTTSYLYNGLRNLIKSTDALGNVRNFFYDGRGLRTAAEDLHAPADTTFGVYAFTYDAAGNIATRVNPNGSTTTYTYNALNQNLTEDDTSTPTLDIGYTYNTCSNGKEKLCASTKDGIIKSYTYDNLGNLATETLADGAASFLTSYTRDRQGNTLTIIHPDNTGVQYGYTNAGLQGSVKFKTTTGTLYNTYVDITATTPNDKPTVVTRASGLVTTHTYDPAHMYRLTNSASQKGVNPKVQDISYGYDPVGNITTYTDNTASTTKKTVAYTYDDLYRLTSAYANNLYNNATPFTESFTYDILGNILSKNATLYTYAGANYANPHAATAIGSDAYTYDTAGNLLSTPTKTFTYNYKNELTSAATPTTLSLYLYAPDGSRLKETTGTTTIHTPTDQYTQTNTNGTLTKTKQVFLNGLYVGSITGNTLSYPTTNHLGSLQKITNASGAITEVTDYYAFGSERLHTGSNSKRRYIGEEYDSTTGLNYLNARYYDGNKGRFISQDPSFWSPQKFLTNPQSMNSYSYANNNPIANKDPLGLFAMSTGKIEKGDTLGGITKLFNDTFKTNLTTSGIAAANNIKDVNKINVGDSIILPKTNLQLHFDNQNLQAYDTTYGVAYDDLKWQGTSGKPGVYDSIPEGTWSIDPQKTEYYKNLPIQQKAASLVGRGLWPGFKRSWGEARTQMTSKETGIVDTGFYVHGGWNAGSRGCIDLTNQTANFHNWFTNVWGKPIDIQVRYPE